MRKTLVMCLILGSIVHADERDYVYTQAQVKFFDAALTIETNARGQKTPPRLEVLLLDNQRRELGKMAFTVGSQWVDKKVGRDAIALFYLDRRPVKGYSKADFLTFPTLMRFDRPSIAECLQNFSAVLKEGGPVDFQSKFTCGEGPHHWTVDLTCHTTIQRRKD